MTSNTAHTRTWLLILMVGVLLIPPLQVQADPCGTGFDYSICNTSAWPKYACYSINSYLGGAIVHLQTDWSSGGPFGLNCNLVDNGYGGDYGRQIQVDMYRPGQSYPTNCWPCDPGCHWGWNPVQAGNCSSGYSGTLQVVQSTNYLYTKTQPMHWDNELGRSNMILEQRLQFVLWNALKVTYTIKNNETYTIQDGGFSVPVAFLEPRLDRAVAYKGSQPWTNGPLTTIDVPAQHNASIDPDPDEPWVAWLETYVGDGGDHGVALYVPFQGNWLVWGLGRTRGSDVEPTNFMLARQTFTLTPGQSKSVIAYLLTGTVEEMRSSIYTLAGH